MSKKIIIKGAKIHNLKNIDLSLPKHELIVFTGLSGSGKSSLAFDTIFAEGQRRYIESLSAYARQFLNQLDKPDVTSIEGLSPAISIDQKAPSKNPRSTVATTTEIYDYLRLLYGSIGKPHCPGCKQSISNQSIQEIFDYIASKYDQKSITILAPLVKQKKGEFKDLFKTLKKSGFSRVSVNQKMYRLDESIECDKNKKVDIELVIDRLTVQSENNSRLFEALELASSQSNGLVMIQTEGVDSKLFSESLVCPDCQISFPELTHRLFSFNSPIGACTNCNGLGQVKEFDPEKVIVDTSRSILFSTAKIIPLYNTYLGDELALALEKKGLDVNYSFDDFSQAQKEWFLYGDNETWLGVMNYLKMSFLKTRSERKRFYFRMFMSYQKCSECDGKRLNEFAHAVTINKKDITQITNYSINDALAYFESLTLTKKEEKITEQLLKEIKSRLSFLKNVGLDYLTLDRKTSSLSGGEFQRIRLASQIGSALTGVLYVLDEPSIGLHQRDNEQLIKTLINLKDLGNTLIVVEHDRDTISSADYIVDIGPKAGKHGGNIMFSGTVKQLLRSKESITAKYLRNELKIEFNNSKKLAKSHPKLRLKGAKEHNLKDITVDFPLGKLICVTGVSGSGKSTLVTDILYPALANKINRTNLTEGNYRSLEGVELIDKVITIDQSPIGRTPRSNPVTYTQVFSMIRDLFAMTKDAKMRGYKSGRFSFNVKGGRCESCEGDGYKKIEMHFLSDVFVKCDVCKGKRFNQETLQIKYKGKNIADVLDMTVNEACEFFANIPRIISKLSVLKEVGLGYIHLGQNATTLSGGEAQRVKLAKELSKKQTGKTLYILDEPTTGLHFEDVSQLLVTLKKLVDYGNSMIIIEHNLDVIKTADHIIDLGPEGGDRGGTVIACGTPQELMKNKDSLTGHYLKKEV